MPGKRLQEGAVVAAAVGWAGTALGCGQVPSAGSLLQEAPASHNLWRQRLRCQALAASRALQ